MAELNTAEELDDINELEYGTDALTGGQDKRMYLYYQLLNSLKRADSVDIVVSFLMESGVRMLLGELDNALEAGSKNQNPYRKLSWYNTAISIISYQA